MSTRAPIDVEFEVIKGPDQPPAIFADTAPTYAQQQAAEFMAMHWAGKVFHAAGMAAFMAFLWWIMPPAHRWLTGAILSLF